MENATRWIGSGPIRGGPPPGPALRSGMPDFDALTDLSSAVTLNNGVRMPVLGLGTWKADDGPEAVAAVRDALEVGYRHVDTAAVYKNEQSVGDALKEFGNRDEVFVTTKLWNDRHGDVAAAMDESLEKLKLDHVDLYLVHWPLGLNFLNTWREMEKLVEVGKTRAIGVSNFQRHHVQVILDAGLTAPAVDQVEFHPKLVQAELHAFLREHGVVSEAWSPLMQGGFADEPVIQRVSRETGKSPAQVLVRWDLQHGVVTIPKSTNRTHIEANADVFDFQLSDAQMQDLNALDEHHRFGPDPDVLGV